MFVKSIVLAAIGAGWGLAVERAAGSRPSGALLVPLGLAAAIVVASLLTAWSITAPAATTVGAVGAVGSLIIARPIRGSIRAVQRLRQRRLRRSGLD